MPHRPAVARERLAQLLHLPAANIARELGCTPDHATIQLLQHGFLFRQTQ